MGKPQLWEGTPLLDGGVPAVHEDCCCLGCSSCSLCEDSDSPQQVEIVFSGVGDVTPLGCDQDNDGTNSAGECSTEFNGVSFILDCEDYNASSCDYALVDDPVAIDELCAGSGTNGAITQMTMSWQTDLTGSSWSKSPTVKIGQSTDAAGTVINYFQWYGTPTYPLGSGGGGTDDDCWDEWVLTAALTQTTGSGNYPCFFGSATVTVNGVV